MPKLAGARIWLSGAVPEVDKSTAAERDAIERFVRHFSARIFALGGHIIHGCHPSFTPHLLTSAREHRDRGGQQDCLTLAISRFFSKGLPADQLAGWRRDCLVYETAEIPENRNESLRHLRQWMADRCDAFVVVGGKWWENAPEIAGVPHELAMATARHIPGFLLGAFGGAAEDYLRKRPDVLDQLQNGLDADTNQQLARLDKVDEVINRVCEQLSRLPLVRGRGTDGVSFRILALDGGGIKGTFTAAALATWEKLTDRRVVEHFDLIAGTSTGGILAIGLGLGLSGQELLNFYMGRGELIFPNTGLWSRFYHHVRHLIRPKYSQEVLLSELERAYYAKNGDMPITLGQSRCRLVIPSYYAIAGASHVFRTPHHPNLIADGTLPAACAALATAAAPTYFSAAKIRNMATEASYVDGGVWANNPATAAIIEAVCFLGVPIDRIDVLSVGCTSEPFTVRKQARAGGINWVLDNKIVKLLMHAQEDSSLKHAKLLVGDTSFLRVDQTTIPGTYTLDGIRDIEELASLGEKVASEPEIVGQIRSRFLNDAPAHPWEKFGPTF